MSRTALIAVIAGAVVVVVALAAITPTVLVDNDHERGVRVQVAPGGWGPFPGKPGWGPGQRFRGDIRPAPSPSR